MEIGEFDLREMTMIDAVNITHHYGVKPVLRDVSLRVERGEVVALMGPNGMGKSTLVSVIAGVLWPIKGFVEIDGLRRRSYEETELEIRRKVVYLSAEPWVPRNRTGRQWMLAVGRLYGVEDDRLMPHVERLLDVFNLSEQADSSIGSYSSGQRKKIAVCCALATEAAVMLLDEPFSGGLDPSAILALKRILQYHAQQRDCTILMATPVPELVEEIADKVAVITRGQIIAFQKVADLKQQTGSANLADAYEHLVSPDSREKIAQYFVGDKR
jgi:ABC-2 type transport system ATP-binding protein